VTKVIWCVVAVLALAGCDAADETAEAACANASCPPGTVIEMNAQSSGSCSGSMEFSADQGLTDQSASGAASGACYTSGSCIYACSTTTVCCGGEEWTQESYTCSQVCAGACGNGECEAGEDGDSCPDDCAAYCGNNECDYGEVCIKQQCTDQTECAACPGDCCPVCGDGICEWPEDGSASEAAACPDDCSGATCQPQCDDPKFCGSDGCISSCPCIGNQACSANDECIAGTGPGPGTGTGTGTGTGDPCVNSTDCSDAEYSERCVDGTCELCPAKCTALPCGDDDCAACGQCGDGGFCKDDGQCFTPNG
jgi:hypothetical protein